MGNAFDFEDVTGVDISDIENLKEIARTHLDYRVRLKAVERIHDEEFLRDIAFEDSSLNVQIACADNLTIQSHLAEIARNHTNINVKIKEIEKNRR